MSVHLQPGSAGALPSATWSAWSCGVRMVVEDRLNLAPAVAIVTRLMGRVERAASRFMTDSELSWANANHGRPVAISGLLVDLVRGALDGARRSSGALDPTVGRHVAGTGYDRDILLVADSADELDAAVTPITRRTWRDVVLDPELGLLTVPAGTSLDLGATAKAHTADRAARAVHAGLGGSALVEIGGDLAVAGPKDDWQVLVAERAGDPAQQITVARGGVATSTTTIRTWRRGSRQVHHIIDPRTGRSTDGPWRTVSVATTTAELANVCATAAIVLGERAVPWLEAQHVAARLVDRAGAITCLGGWPSAERTGVVAVGTGGVELGAIGRV